MAISRFRSAFTKEDLVIDATVLNTGNYQKVGEYVLKAGEEIELGYGNGGQESAQGRIFVKLMDTTATPVEITGTVRIMALTAQDIPLGVLFEARTESLNANATDRTKQIPFNIGDFPFGLSEDKKFQLQIKPDATKTVSKENSLILIDITKTVN